MSRTTGQASYLVILRNVSIESDVFQVLPNEVRRGITLTSALPRRFQIIELLNELGETLGDKLLPRNPRVEPMIQAYMFVIGSVGEL